MKVDIDQILLLIIKKIASILSPALKEFFLCELKDYKKNAFLYWQIAVSLII